MKNEVKELLQYKTHNEVVDHIGGKDWEGNFDRFDEELFTIFTPKGMINDEVMPCFVSHTDTVSKTKPKKFIDKKGRLSNVNGVLGADDRAGCYILGQMLEKGVRGIYILTDLEEVGGVGASACAKSDIFQVLTEQMSALIELDRMGNSDCATYSYDNEDLIGLFSDIGYKEAWGSYTDVVSLAQECDLSCVNLSVGYYNEHTANEYLVWSELENTCRVMLNDLPSELYTEVFNAEPYRGTGASDKEEVCCDCCGAHDLLYYSERGELLCEECLSFEEGGGVSEWSFKQYLENEGVV